MKRWLFLLLMVAGCQLVVYAEEEILVVVTQVRNDEGNILVMIQTDENEKPFYGLSEAQKGIVSVVIKGVFDRPFLISVFHDENADWEMDMDEQGRPIEGFARKSLRAFPEDGKCMLTLFYPSNE